MPDPPVASPLRELDLRDEARSHEVRDFPEPPGWRWIEWRLVDRDLLEVASQLTAERRAPASAGTDLSGEAQTIPLIVAHENGPDPDTRPRRIGKSADHEFLPFDAFD